MNNKNFIEENKKKKLKDIKNLFLNKSVFIT